MRDEDFAIITHELRYGRTDVISINGGTEYSFTNGQWEDFCQVIHNRSSLRGLVLIGLTINNDKVLQLVRVLLEKPELTILDLSGNVIGDRGACEIAGPLLRQLEHLNLSGNEISDEGARALAEGLKKDHHLGYLCLQRNRIGKPGVAALGSSDIKNRENINLDFFDSEDDEVGDVMQFESPMGLQVSSMKEKVSMDMGGRNITLPPEIETASQAAREALQTASAALEKSVSSCTLEDIEGKLCMAAVALSDSKKIIDGQSPVPESVAALREVTGELNEAIAVASQVASKAEGQDECGSTLPAAIAALQVTAAAASDVVNSLMQTVMATSRSPAVKVSVGIQPMVGHLDAVVAKPRKPTIFEPMRASQEEPRSWSLVDLEPSVASTTVDIYCSQTGFQDIAQIDSSSLEFPRERDASKRGLFGINEYCKQARNKAENQNAESISQMFITERQVVITSLQQLEDTLQMANLTEVPVFVDALPEAMAALREAVAVASQEAIVSALLLAITELQVTVTLMPTISQGSEDILEEVTKALPNAIASLQSVAVTTNQEDTKDKLQAVAAALQNVAEAAQAAIMSTLPEASVRP